MAKVEKTSKKVGSRAAQQLKSAKAAKNAKPADTSTLSQMPDKGKESAKKKK